MLSARSALQAPTGAALLPQARQPLALRAQRPAAPASQISSAQQQLGVPQQPQAHQQQRRRAVVGARQQRRRAATTMSADGGQPKKIRTLFVCLGNICRSPSAEAVFKSGKGCRFVGREANGTQPCAHLAHLLTNLPQWWSAPAWRTSLRSTAAAQGEAAPTGIARAASGAGDFRCPHRCSYRQSCLRPLLPSPSVCPPALCPPGPRAPSTCCPCPPQLHAATTRATPPTRA